ncbi:MAG: acetate uptake transporter [Planctomycetes bacterium]|nr:acetate uptake transporter [Planctomycetota bacterium]
MQASENIITIKDSTSNPAPLGLLAFGMTTVLLNLHNAGLYGMDTMILSMGIFYGGMAQIIAGIMEWKKGNTFGTAAFCSYGAFWFTLVGLIVFPKYEWATKPDDNAMIAYLTIWGLFTFVMFIGTLRLNRALQVIFLSLTVLFSMLAIAHAITDPELKKSFMKITGIEGIFCGASAIYAGLAQVLNEVYAKTVLPLGPVKTSNE